MPDPNAIFSSRVRLADPPERAAEFLRAGERGVELELDEGRRVALDPANPRSPGFARILDRLGRRGRPVYLKLDPESRAVVRILIPLIARVIGLTANDRGYEFELDRSHARHRLRRSHPDFADAETVLREALDSRVPVALSEDDAHDLVDIRFFRPGPDDGRLIRPDLPPGPRRPLPAPARWLARIVNWPIWSSWSERRCMSLFEAQQVLDAMSATSCDPTAVPPPCIPFLYPDNGCWARAHEMCRLMIAMGHHPKKVWIQGRLHTPTRNHPDCFVGWRWHVAPTLCVRQSCWIFVWSAQMVIDPALFTGPVTQETWKGAQGDPNATLTPSAASIYYFWGNVTDSTYSDTNDVLEDHRDLLQTRSNQIGPPPYANCP